MARDAGCGDPELARGTALPCRAVSARGPARWQRRAARRGAGNGRTRHDRGARALARRGRTGAPARGRVAHRECATGGCRDRGGARLGERLLPLRSLPQFAARGDGGRAAGAARVSRHGLCAQRRRRLRPGAGPDQHAGGRHDPGHPRRRVVRARPASRCRRAHRRRRGAARGIPGRSRGRSRVRERTAVDRPALGRELASEGHAGGEGRLLRFRWPGSSRPPRACCS